MFLIGKLKILFLLSIICSFQFSFACDDLVETIITETKQGRGPDQFYFLNERLSLGLLGIVEADLERLKLPVELKETYYSLSEAAAFLWETPFNHPEKVDMFNDLSSFLMTSKMIGDHTFELVTQKFSKSNKKDLVRSEQHLEDLAYLACLGAFIHQNNVIKKTPSLTYKFGDFFATSFFPHRIDFVTISSIQKPVLDIPIMSDRLMSFIKEHSPPGDTMAVMKYLIQKELKDSQISRKTSKKELEILYKGLLSEIDSNNLDENSFKEVFRDLLFTELDYVDDAYAYILDGAFENLKYQNLLKKALISESKYPYKVASFISSFMFFVESGTMMKDWNVKVLKSVLTNTLTHLIGNFRRSIRPYLELESVNNRLSDSTPDIKEPVYFVVKINSAKKKVEPPARNPNKRKNQEIQTLDDIPEIGHIPIISTGEKTEVLYDFLPYSHHLKKELKKLQERKIADLFHEVYLPQILKNPKKGKHLKGKFAKKIYRLDFDFEGDQFRIGYRIVNNKVEILAIGVRGGFYARLENRI